jgi:hypothetical protein
MADEEQMRRSIPIIQERSLYPLAQELYDLGLTDVARRLRLYTTELYRRKGKYRTRNGRAKMTPELRSQIRQFASAHPKWDNQRIAEKFNVNSARVSETLNGTRDNN